MRTTDVQYKSMEGQQNQGPTLPEMLRHTCAGQKRGGKDVNGRSHDCLMTTHYVAKSCNNKKPVLRPTFCGLKAHCHQNFVSFHLPIKFSLPRSGHSSKHSST
jgi:hypothetical protein